MQTISVSELQELEPGTGHVGQYGNVAETFREILGELDVGEAAARSEIVKELEARTELPKGQASTRVNGFVKRTWFTKEFGLFVNSDSAQLIGRIAESDGEAIMDDGDENVEDEATAAVVE